MDTIEIKPRDLHRRTAWAMAEARKGKIIVISGTPPLILQAGQPPAPESSLDWDAHFAWLKQQPMVQKNTVDDLRSLENR